MRLIHITDPHLTCLDAYRLHALNGKRRLGYLSWRRKRRHIHRSDVLDEIMRAIHLEHADQILLTGDLVHIGLAEEIEQAGRWLRSLGPPEQVRVVLGNHDVYASDSMNAIRRDWSPYVTGDGQVWTHRLSKDNLELQIVGLCSSLPTPALMASGKLGAGQLQDFARLDMDAGVFQCVLIHHPPLPGVAPWRKALRDVRNFCALLQRKRPQLTLHGHMHRNTRAWVVSGQSVVYGTASASSAHAAAPASYRVFDISHEGSDWRLDMALKCFDLAARRVFTLETETLQLRAQHRERN